MKTILCQFIQGQTHFGMPGGANMSLALNEPKQVALHSNSNTASELAPQWKDVIRTVCKTTNRKSQGTNSNNKDNSTVDCDAKYVFVSKGTQIVYLSPNLQ